MAITKLTTDFKDDILSDSSGRRKFQMIDNGDGTYSFVDVSDYSQTGSAYGAKEVNEAREAINNIDERRLVSLDEIDLVTEEGCFVDAKAAAELNRKLQYGRVATSISSGSSYKDYTVTFTKEFSAVPAVQLTIATSTTTLDNVVIPAIMTVSVTGFTFRVYRQKGASTTSNPAPYVHWMATI